MRVLVAEDDDNIREGLREILEAEGYATTAARNGSEALERYNKAKPDFVLLDIMMPEMSGYDVCREIRKNDAGIPIIFISAKSEEIDRVLGLELGADDYIMKPFGVREVIARIRAVTRRCMAAQSNTSTTDQKPASFQMGDIDVFPAELRARRGRDVMDLSLRDVRILDTLYRHKGEVVDRDTFFNECWGYDYAPNSRTLDQHIAQLRKRIERDAKKPAIIQTVHGAGYRYEE